jgi:mono/diheme cytochrome c family protein
MIFQSECASCHAQDGKGGLPDTPDFTWTEINHEWRAFLGRYRRAVSDGTGVMHSFRSTLKKWINSM